MATRTGILACLPNMAILLYAGTCNSAAFYVAGWLSGRGMEEEDIWMKISGNKEIVGVFLFTYYGLDIERPVYAVG